MKIYLELIYPLDYGLLNKMYCAWLAQKISKDKSKLRRILKKETMDVELIFAISAGMGFDFFRYYSFLLHRETQRRHRGHGVFVFV